MIMVQRAQAPAMLAHAHAHHHRRHPSAPVVVQPTRTPGLLSLSKPLNPRSTPQRASRGANSSTTNNNSNNLLSNTKSSVDEQNKVQAPSRDLTSSPAVVRTPATAATTADAKPSRGRQNALKPPKDQSRRSASHSSSRAQQRRQPHHQPSPPAPHLLSSTPTPGQGKGRRGRHGASRSQHTLNLPPNPSANAFDPFLASSGSDSETTTTISPNGVNKQQQVTAAAAGMRTAPKISRPSGRLARRRQDQSQSGDFSTAPLPQAPAPFAPAPTARRPMPVPRRSDSLPTTTTTTLSRSTPARPAAIMKGEFPVCDDSEDSDDLPVTPTKPSRPATGARANSNNKVGGQKSHSVGRAQGAGATWQQALTFDEGPRTAPLTSTGFDFSSPVSAKARSPAPVQVQARARMAMPTSVFDMSLDEELSDPEQAIYGLTPTGYKFASSQFQNSPSPDDLPAPSF